MAALGLRQDGFEFGGAVLDGSDGHGDGRGRDADDQRGFTTTV